MNNMKPIEVINDFLETIFLLIMISLLVFYFIVKDNWGVAEETIKIASSLSILAAAFFFKIKKVKIEIKEKKEREESLNDIFCYFNKSDKIKNIIITSVLVFLISLTNYLWGTDKNTIWTQILLISSILYFWHFYLFRKRDDVTIKMYALFLDEIIDSILKYLLSMLVLIIPLLFNSYSYVDILNAFIIIIILYLKHKIIFDLNKKK